jgi:hypothetical protein
VIPLAYYLLVRHEPVVMTPALKLILLLFVAELVSAIFSRDPGTAAEGLFKFAVEGVFLVAAVTNVVRDFGTVRLAVWLLLIVGGILGLLSAYQQATGSYDSGLPRVRPGVAGRDRHRPDRQTASSPASHAWPARSARRTATPRSSSCCCPWRSPGSGTSVRGC